MSHHVMVKLPDGRIASADYRQPITHVLKKVLKRRSEFRPEQENAADYELIAEWLDCCPEQACTIDDMLQGEGCGGKHPAALAEPFTPPRYVRPLPEIVRDAQQAVRESRAGQVNEIVNNVVDAVNESRQSVRAEKRRRDWGPQL